MVDALQFVTIVGLGVVAVTPLAIVARKLWSKRLLGRKTEEVPPITLQDAMLFGFAVFALFSCGMPAFCLYLMGWGEFMRAALIFAGFGLFAGAFFGGFSYIGNNIQHRRAEKRKKRRLNTFTSTAVGTAKGAAYVVAGVVCFIAAIALFVMSTSIFDAVLLSISLALGIIGIVSLYTGVVAVAARRHG